MQLGNDSFTFKRLTYFFDRVLICTFKSSKVDAGSSMLEGLDFSIRECLENDFLGTTNFDRDLVADFDVLNDLDLTIDLDRDVFFRSEDDDEIFQISDSSSAPSCSSDKSSYNDESKSLIENDDRIGTLNCDKLVKLKTIWLNMYFKILLLKKRIRDYV